MRRALGETLEAAQEGELENLKGTCAQYSTRRLVVAGVFNRFAHSAGPGLRGYRIGYLPSRINE